MSITSSAPDPLPSPPLYTDASSPPPLRGSARLRAWLDMLFTDHGLLRMVFPNAGRVSAGIERRGHPTPGAIRRAAHRGIHTVINLRGENRSGSYALSREACERHGIRLVNFQLKSRRLPTREQILAVRDLFAEVEYPVMLHCKSGADRAGLLSALYLLLCEQRPVEEALQQLSFRYFHFNQAQTGVLDHLLLTYRAARDAARADGRELDFLDWVQSDYDAEQVQAGFRSRGWANWLIDKILQRE